MSERAIVGRAWTAALAAAVYECTAGSPVATRTTAFGTDAATIAVSRDS